MKRDALVTIRLPASHKAKLEKWAERDNCSISDIINELICKKVRSEKRLERKARNQEGE